MTIVFFSLTLGILKNYLKKTTLQNQILLQKLQQLTIKSFLSSYNENHQIKWFSLKFASNIIRLSTMCCFNNSFHRVNAGENLLAKPIASLQRISTTLDQMCSCSTDENRCTFQTLTSCMTINEKSLQCIDALDQLQLSRKKRDASALVSKKRMPKYLVSSSTKFTPIFTILEYKYLKI